MPSTEADETLGERLVRGTGEEEEEEGEAVGEDDEPIAAEEPPGLVGGDPVVAGGASELAFEAPLVRDRERVRLRAWSRPCVVV